MDGLLLALDRLDRGAARPLSLQLADAMRDAVRTGLARPGDAVPSTRTLAVRLGVSRGVVVRAYDQLAGEGCLDLHPGSGARVAALPVLPALPIPDAVPAPGGRPAAGVGSAGAGRASGRPAPGARRASGTRTPGASAASAPDAGTATGPAHLADLSPGAPSTARLDERAWRAAWRAAANAHVPSGWSDPRGLPRLREAIAEHLRVARGVDVGADAIRVTAGTSEAFSLLALALADRLGRPPIVAVEDPGYPTARRILARHGARLVPLPVDADGFDADALRALGSPPDAALLTPSHQYPLGGRLPLARRLALVEWARATGGMLLEDDYDSEFRHAGAPMPALASLDGERTVLLGTLSKVLAPTLRLGWAVVADPALAAAVDRVRADLDSPVPAVVQDAMAGLLESGALRRHIAAARRDYAHRRSLVTAALGDLDAPGVRLGALDGGLHAVLELPAREAEASVLAGLAGAGVRLAPLSAYCAETGASGLVFGYAAPSDLRLSAALARIRDAVVAAV